MAAMSLSALLSTLTDSISSAEASIPELKTFAPPVDGISLLDTKNELLLSYLQNLVFLIILKLRTSDEHQAFKTRNGELGIKNTDSQDQVVKKLVELRVYLEKGVRPLESRLKYQIDKVLRAADDAARSAMQKSNGQVKKSKATNGRHHSDVSASNSENEGSQLSSDDHGPDVTAAPEINDLAYRPNPSSFIRPTQPSTLDSLIVSKPTSIIYRPPRITPTSLPTTTRPNDNSASTRHSKPLKSATLDEFVATELSSAPVPEPSIGSTIINGGRRSKSQKERETDGKRRVYEESNFVRLPKESRKERKKAEGGRNGGYGGEDWRGLDEGAERIVGLTKGKRGGGALERSRKRERDGQDGPRGDGRGEGMGIGERFEKRRKTMEGRERRRK
ncbi:hypothetical protein MMC24_007344 [Lignoscripta atroalba]|nr:hypothetical protein [Lignoscripta atroalba]